MKKVGLILGGCVLGVAMFTVSFADQWDPNDPLSPDKMGVCVYSSTAPAAFCGQSVSTTYDPSGCFQTVSAEGDSWVMTDKAYNNGGIPLDQAWQDVYKDLVTDHMSPTMACAAQATWAVAHHYTDASAIYTLCVATITAFQTNCLKSS